ncbi:MAG TPA: M20/M25/M40 family metallo-hydrolase [Gemmatimonadales bacterium]|nr:M20/M25/M40 family metallo-hydrolase [Gemmatimonadales bacterium]
MRRRFALLLLLFTPAPVAAQAGPPRTHRPAPTVPAITPGDLMTRLYIFADDSMQGREAGTPGNVKGTDYIAAEIKRAGLVPAGDDGTYFQTIPLKTRTFDTTSTFTLAGAPLTAFTDYLPLGPRPLESQALSIVFGGEVGDSATRITAEQASGKLVVLRVPGGALGLRALRNAPSVPGAAGVALVALDSLPPQVVAFLRRPRTVLDDGSAAQAPAFVITAATAAKMFTTPLEQLTPGAAGTTAAVAVRFDVVPVADPARNVVGIVPGSDPKLKGEYIAVGAHNDHIGLSRVAVDHDSIRIWNHLVRPEGADDAGKQATPEQQARVDSLLARFRSGHRGGSRVDSIANGADDDGSGSVAALEIAERIASLKRKPKRSILFVWHTGEEKGLLGSRYFTDHPTVPRDSIVAQLNMDMVGRGAASDETGHTRDGAPLHGGPRYLQLVGSRRLSTELGDLVERVNTAGRHGLVFDYSIDADGHPANIYCRSDHYEYARYGIPITFFTTGLHSDYHQVTDEPEYIDYEHMARVANLVEDVALQVADLDHRVLVDHPKPDPHAPCRQ